VKKLAASAQAISSEGNEEKNPAAPRSAGFKFARSEEA
jgi:hypothetical protein